jgi:hypothetical protein
MIHKYPIHPILNRHFSDRQRTKTAANVMTMTPLFYLMTMSNDRFGIVRGGGGIEFIGMAWASEL